MSDTNNAPAPHIKLPEPSGHPTGVLVFAHGVPTHFAITEDADIPRLASAIALQQQHMLDGGSQIETIAMTDAVQGTTYYLTPFGIREVIIIGKAMIQNVAPRRGRGIELPGDIPIVPFDPFKRG